jgi:hypothetical protein
VDLVGDWLLGRFVNRDGSVLALLWLVTDFLRRRVNRGGSVPAVMAV